MRIYTRMMATAALMGGVLGSSGSLVVGATATNSLGVTLSVTAACTVTSGSLSFGTQGVLASNVDQSTTFSVTCTTSTPYTIGLDAGANGASVTTRKLKSATTTATVDYFLYSDTGRTTNWGNTAGAWVSGTGAGSAQTITVYGRIPPQTTPAPATDYTDTIGITVTY